MSKYKERFKTYQNVFDEFTYRNIFKLISEGYFEGIEGPVSIGKEANIFSAVKKDGSRAIVKIYRLETCDFNRMYDYIRYDPRFVKLKKQKRKVIFAWAQREYRNLLKARQADVAVPTPFTFKFNILVEELIGKEQAAPMLKDSHPKNKKAFFEDIVENMKRLYKAGLVHGDLSEFNILNHEERPVLIDLSQGTQLDNPCAKDYFDRDIRNVCRFFRKIGLSEKICDEEKVRERVVG